MSAPSTATTLRRLDRLDGRRAALVLEHRQLAEEVVRAERRERDRAPVARVAHRPGAAGADHVTGVARVALAEHAPRPARTRAARRPRAIRSRSSRARALKTGTRASSSAVDDALVTHLSRIAHRAARRATGAALAPAAATFRLHGPIRPHCSQSTALMAAAGGRRRRARAAAPQLWATIDECSRRRSPNRPSACSRSMPGGGKRGLRMYVRIRLQYRDSCGRWRDLATAADTGNLALGKREPSARTRASFGSRAARKPPCCARVVSFAWRRGRRTVVRRSALTSARRPTGRYARPQNFSVASLPALVVEQPRIVGDDPVDAERFSRRIAAASSTVQTNSWPPPSWTCSTQRRRHDPPVRHQRVAAARRESPPRARAGSVRR